MPLFAVGDDLARTRIEVVDLALGKG